MTKKKPTNELEMLAGEPMDAVGGKELRFILEAIKDKDIKMARSFSVILSQDENPEKRSLGENLIETIDFLHKHFQGKDLKAPEKDLKSIILLDKLKNFLPTDEEVKEELRESIKKSGILDPLICKMQGEDIVLIDGYTRYEIAEELGMRRVPVIVLGEFDGDPEVLSVVLNMVRRHLTKEVRQEFIDKFPVPKVGRPKKLPKPEFVEEEEDEDGLKPMSAKKLAKMLGVSDRTIKRDRKPVSNKIKDLDTEIGTMSPFPKGREFRDLATKLEFDSFLRTGYIQTRSFRVDFPVPPSDEDVKKAHRYLDDCIGDVLDYIAKKELQEEVKCVEFSWDCKIVRKE